MPGKFICILLCFTMLPLMSPSVPNSAPEPYMASQAAFPGVQRMAKKADDEEDGLVKKDGCYYYYKNGEPVTNKWITEDGEKYYFKENGEAASGIVVINKKFCCFNSKMKYDGAKTKKIRKAAKYEKPFDALKKFIGKPDKSRYYSSCYGKGKDGVLKYNGFTVYTFKPENGKEIFMGVE